MNEFFFYEDVIEVTEDYRNASQSIIAKKGQKGFIKQQQHSKFQHIDVLLDGNDICRRLPTWILKMIEPNIKGREEDKNKNERLTKLQEDMNIKIGDTVTIYPTFSDKTCQIIVTGLNKELTGVYGYRIKKNGDRYKGRLGEEDYFTIYQLIPREKKTLSTPYQVGNICLYEEFNRNIIRDVGVVVKVTTRTYHVEIQKSKKPRIFKLGESSTPRTIEQVMKTLRNDSPYCKYAMYQKAKEKLDVLGLDTSNVEVIPDDYLQTEREVWNY